MSGAGKSVALNALEDLGFYSVDNLPLQLLPKLADLYHDTGINLTRIAVGVDVRVGALLDEFTKSLQDLSQRGITYQIMFLEARDLVLIRRFSETRRRHPLGRTVRGGIGEERKRLKVIRQLSDAIIDTSRANPNELKGILSRSLKLQRSRSMAVTVISFGYKFGIPIDADVIFDARFLPNPNYVPKLKKLNGLNKKVSRYVLSNPLTKKYLKSVKRQLSLTVPYYVREGKSYLTVGMGCTGGKHRSVALAEILKDYLTSKKLPTRIIHRDIHS
ncbi:RNase adaptor protein RapZ [bacterium F11]|nr:RNase adaptor protein RapZ [bacterium F11]